MINSKGITVKNLDTVKTELEAAYQEIYGSIDLSQNTPDGQRVGIQALQISQLNELVLATYNSFDPLLAQGLQIDRLSKFVGIVRRPATKSVAKVQIEVSAPISLPQNYTIKDINGNIWEIDTAELNLTENTLITFTAKEYGATVALATEINEPAINFAEVLSVSNPADADIGNEEETDKELRLRFNSTKETRSKNTTLTIGSELTSIHNVKSVNIIENDTSTVKNGQPAHSLRVIVLGGSDQEIARVIINNKTAGVQLIGAVEQQYTENLGDYTTTQTAKFDRPTQKIVTLRFSIDGEVELNEIERVLERNLTIGEELVLNTLIAPIYALYPSVKILSLEAKTSDTEFTTANITANSAEYISVSKFELV